MAKKKGTPVEYAPPGTLSTGPPANPFVKTGWSSLQSANDLREQLLAASQAEVGAYQQAATGLKQTQKTGLEDIRARAGQAVTSAWGGAGGYGAVAGGAQTAALRQAALDAAAQTNAWNLGMQQQINAANKEAAAAQKAALEFQQLQGTPEGDRIARNAAIQEDFYNFRELYAGDKNARDKVRNAMKERLASEPDPTLRAYWHQVLIEQGFAAPDELKTEVG